MNINFTPHRILILLPSEYPFGGAQALRMMLIAHGFVISGFDCRILGLCKEHNTASCNDKWNFDSNNILFFNAVLETDCSVGDVLLRESSKLYQYWKYDFLLAYGPFWSSIGPSIRFADNSGVRVFADCTEWYAFRPWRIYSLTYWDHVHFRYNLRTLSGAIAISRYWKKYLQSINVPVIRVPALIDSLSCPEEKICSDFECEKPLKLGYFGALSNRNLFATLLKSIQIARNYIDVTLHCYGHQALPVNHPVHNMVEKFHIREFVYFCGWLPSHRDVIVKMQNCDALVLLRDSDIASIASFPTRLPEYLLSGKPVVVSRVGDIAEYLEDRVSAYFVPPGDHPKNIAGKLFDICQYKAEAKNIGRRGAEVAKKHFSYVDHGCRLAEFLVSFKK